jgi:hypothetical protein
MECTTTSAHTSSALPSLFLFYLLHTSRDPSNCATIDNLITMVSTTLTASAVNCFCLKILLSYLFCVCLKHSLTKELIVSGEPLTTEVWKTRLQDGLALGIVAVLVKEGGIETIEEIVENEITEIIEITETAAIAEAVEGGAREGAFRMPGGIEIVTSRGRRDTTRTRGQERDDVGASRESIVTRMTDATLSPTADSHLMVGLICCGVSVVIFLGIEMY